MGEIGHHHIQAPQAAANPSAILPSTEGWQKHRELHALLFAPPLGGANREGLWAGIYGL